MVQLSVLRVFQAILSDRAFRKQEGSAEVTHLATHVTRNLFARLVPLNPYEGDTTSTCIMAESHAVAMVLCFIYIGNESAMLHVAEISF